jgi:hypothetical protein
VAARVRGVEQLAHRDFDGGAQSFQRTRQKCFLQQAPHPRVIGWIQVDHPTRVMVQQRFDLFEEAFRELALDHVGDPAATRKYFRVQQHGRDILIVTQHPAFPSRTKINASVCPERGVDGIGIVGIG